MTQAAQPGSDEMFCWSCGSIVKTRAEICVHCGVRVNQQTSMSGTQFGGILSTEYSEKSRVAAGVLGIILGGIGVHRFYLGNIGIGILQIIVTLITFGFGATWGFVEGVIIIAGGKWRDGDGKPLRPHGQ